MDKETKDIVSDIDTLKKIKESLEEDIAKLQIAHNSLEAQEHTAQIKDEQDEKIKNVETMNKYAAEERRIESKRIEAEKRIDTAEILEQKLNSREKEVENREQKLIDLENKIVDLNRQRSDFQLYKNGVEKELDEAREIIAQADEAFAKIQSEKDMLAGRETKVKIQEKYWNDEIGKLEADKKQFQLERENFIGLDKKMEATNG